MKSVLSLLIASAVLKVGLDGHGRRPILRLKRFSILAGAPPQTSLGGVVGGMPMLELLST